MSAVSDDRSVEARIADALSVLDRHDALADHWGVARPAWVAEVRRALTGGGPAKEKR